MKRERVALERDFHKQVQTLIEEKGVENIVGSQQLLSLCAPVEIGNDDEYIDSIFATQIDSEFYKDHSASNDGSDETGNSKLNCEGKRKDGDEQKNKTNFIRRNIDLASHANEVIALTDEEKRRLDELLADDNDLLIGENPFSTPVLKNDGFQFSIDDKKTLDDIDERLKNFLSEDEFNSGILSQSQTSIASSVPNHEEYVLPNEQNTQCGEKVLNEGQSQRGMVHRLCEIEKKLQKLRINVDSPTFEKIDPDLLRSLLEVDSRMTSDSKSICDSVMSCSNYGDDDDEFLESSAASLVVDGDDKQEVDPGTYNTM